MIPKKRMVLIDASNFYTIVTSGLWANANDFYNEQGVRDAILTGIFNHVKEYWTGNIILACDAPRKSLWRKDILESYKFKRDIPTPFVQGQFDRKEAFVKFINPIQEEIINFLPFVVMKTERCEADDIIGALVNMCYKSGNCDAIISSNDSDFDQLIVNRSGENNTSVIRVCLENFELVFRESKFDSLMEMIIRGATKDSVPNAYSPDNFLTEQYANPEAKMRQKAISKKVLANIKTEADAIAEFPYYNRNKQLIDLTCIPENIVTQIRNEYISKFADKRSRIDTAVEYMEAKGVSKNVIDLYHRIKQYL